MTPQERIFKNKDLINLILEHQYLPQKSNAQFGEIVSALKEINPKGNYEPGCSGCITDIVRVAKVHLLAYEDSLKSASFHKFPKHKKK